MVGRHLPSGRRLHPVGHLAPEVSKSCFAQAVGATFGAVGGSLGATVEVSGGGDVVHCEDYRAVPPPVLGGADQALGNSDLVGRLPEVFPALPGLFPALSRQSAKTRDVFSPFIQEINAQKE